jgi:hypothetical protein
MRVLAQKRIWGWGVLTGVPALFVVAWLLGLFPAVLDSMPLCAVRHFLGCPCPGCGLTHSLAALTHGEIRASIDAHPMGVVIALWLCWLFLREVWRMVRGSPMPALVGVETRDWLVGAFIAALMSQWIVHLVIG